MMLKLNPWILKAGYHADVVVFEKDLMTMPKEEIMKNRVDVTIVGVKIVYKRAGTR